MNQQQNSRDTEAMTLPYAISTCQRDGIQVGVARPPVRSTVSSKLDEFGNKSDSGTEDMVRNNLRREAELEDENSSGE